MRSAPLSLFGDPLCFCPHSRTKLTLSHLSWTYHASPLNPSSSQVFSSLLCQDWTKDLLWILQNCVAPHMIISWECTLLFNRAEVDRWKNRSYSAEHWTAKHDQILFKLTHSHRHSFSSDFVHHSYTRLQFKLLLEGVEPQPTSTSLWQNFQISHLCIDR